MTRILLSGGSGLLGTSLLELLPTIVAPTHQEMDITQYDNIESSITKHQPEIFLHSAALVGTRQCRQDLLRCLSVNVHGTQNVVIACFRHHIRLVYISTDYVFDGNLGNYSEVDQVNPLAEYAKSKVAGEMMVSCCPNNLIIRTTFCSAKKWKFDGAFTDQYSSGDTIDVIGPDILRAAASDLTGIIHIGTERKSQYELARRINPRVKPITQDQVELPLPRDTSLDCSRWNAYKATHGSP